MSRMQCYFEERSVYNKPGTEGSGKALEQARTSGSRGVFVTGITNVFNTLPSTGNETPHRAN